MLYKKLYDVWATYNFHKIYGPSMFQICRHVVSTDGRYMPKSPKYLFFKVDGRALGSSSNC